MKDKKGKTGVLPELHLPGRQHTALQEGDCESQAQMREEAAEE